jgi:hypothetical protein
MSDGVVCIDGRGPKLVEARFLGTLPAKKREHLEAHLIACSACAERYRRLQLADRLAAARGELAPEDAAREPSAAEIDRVAGDLGLLAAPEPRRSWWLSPIFGASVAIGSAALVTMLVVLGRSSRDPVEELAARGSVEARISFAAYLIGTDGAIRRHDPSAKVSPKDHLKLRASWQGASAPSPLRLVLVPAVGSPALIALEAPKRSGEGSSSSEAASGSVPGAVSLETLPPGKALAYLIAGPIDESRLLGHAAARPSAAALLAAIGDAGTATIERIELEVAPP